MSNFAPTTAPAGSEEKVAVLCERVRLGLPLFHPLDNHERLAQRLMNADEYRGTVDRNIFARGDGHFSVKCSRGGKQVYVGFFASIGEAAAARDSFEATHQKPPKKPRKRATGADRYIYPQGRQRRRFMVKVTRGSTYHYVGTFGSFEEAVEARDAWLRQNGELAEAS